jgi:hypothetical protein
MGIILAVCKEVNRKMCTVSQLINNNEKTCDACFIYRKMSAFVELLMALSEGKPEGAHWTPR